MDGVAWAVGSLLASPCPEDTAGRAEETAKACSCGMAVCILGYFCMVKPKEYRWTDRQTAFFMPIC